MLLYCVVYGVVQICVGYMTEKGVKRYIQLNSSKPN